MQGSDLSQLITQLSTALLHHRYGNGSDTTAGTNYIQRVTNPLISFFNSPPILLTNRKSELISELTHIFQQQLRISTSHGHVLYRSLSLSSVLAAWPCWLFSYCFRGLDSSQDRALLKYNENLLREQRKSSNK